MKSVTSQAPINIALLKYWGKRDEQLVLPYTDSISLSLDLFQTTTTLSYQETETPTFELNGCSDEKSAPKIFSFIKKMIGTEPKNLHISTRNSGPTAAGLASSASGYAALSVAVNHYYNLQLSEADLQTFTRMGSGSAIRSLKGGCVLWRRDGLIESVAFPFEDVVMAIFIVSHKQKQIGSTEAMRFSVQTSPLFPNWVEQSISDNIEFLHALQTNNFSLMGEISEQNALRMHRVCETTQPAIRYLTEQSYELIHAIQEARKQRIPVYATADAGPNVKAILRKNDLPAFLKYMKQVTTITPLISGISLQGARIIDETI